MEHVYLLFTETPDGGTRIADTGKGKPVVAHEDNQHLLVVIGNALLKNGTIRGYQVLKTSGPIVREYDLALKLSSFTPKGLQR